jgi:hypothetical protein
MTYKVLAWSICAIILQREVALNGLKGGIWRAVEDECASWCLHTEDLKDFWCSMLARLAL